MNLYEVETRFSESLMKGNVCDISLSIIVQPKTIPTQIIFVWRIKTLENPVKQCNFFLFVFLSIYQNTYRRLQKYYAVVLCYTKAFLESL